MITTTEFHTAQQRAAEMIRQAGIVMTATEQDAIQVADFGLSRLEREGAQILTLVETERLAVKVIALFPGQTLPEHWHPPVGDDPGKEETFRVVSGPLYFYIDGKETLQQGQIPPGQDAYYTVRHECVLRPAEQIMVVPGAKHWLQAGPQGVVVYSFSTCARDVLDGFSNPQIVRVTQIVDDRSHER
jgi:D-lyxose ketol-isomerase